MTEYSTSVAIGQASIDAYLESVERALLDAQAPRSERLQVLQDLESQIADMLAQLPQPVTEQTVQDVIATLEPPRHFAETYGTQGKETRSRQPNGTATVALNRWVAVSAISCALIPLGCLLLVFAAATSMNGLAVLIATLPLIVGCVLTPIALRKGFRQLRAAPARYLGRELALGTMVGYVATAPLLLLLIACVVTEGAVLYLLAIAAFFYFQYLLMRKVWQRMADALPPRAAADVSREHSDRDSSSPTSFVTGAAMAT
jgi:hypothetical protein